MEGQGNGGGGGGGDGIALLLLGERGEEDEIKGREAGAQGQSRTCTLYMRWEAHVGARQAVVRAQVGDVTGGDRRRKEWWRAIAGSGETTGKAARN